MLCCRMFRNHWGSRQQRLPRHPGSDFMDPASSVLRSAHVASPADQPASSVPPSTHGAPGHEEPSLPQRLGEPSVPHHDRIVRPPPHGLPIVECQLCGTEWTIVSGDQGMDRDYECRNNRCSFCDVPLVGKGLGKGRSGVRRPRGAGQSGVPRSVPLTEPQQAVLLQEHPEIFDVNMDYVVDHLEQNRLRLPRTRDRKSFGAG